MRYLLVKETAVAAYGFCPNGRMVRDGRTFLTEKEVVTSPRFPGTDGFESRAATLGGEIHTAQQARMFLRGETNYKQTNP